MRAAPGPPAACPGWLSSFPPGPSFPRRGTLPSNAEQTVIRSFRAILADLPEEAEVADSDLSRDGLSGLEHFIPAVLGVTCPEWTTERLDGVLPVVVRKLGAGEIEVLGIGVLISDQCLTPLYVRFQLSESVDQISWLDCRIGERRRRGMARTPSDSLALEKRLYALDCDPDRVDWAYRVTLGQRRTRP